MERAPSIFTIDTIKFRNGIMVSDFPDEPQEPASYWKAVADGTKLRLDKVAESNEANRDARTRAEKRNASQRVQIEHLEEQLGELHMRQTS